MFKYPKNSNERGGSNGEDVPYPLIYTLQILQTGPHCSVLTHFIPFAYLLFTGTDEEHAGNVIHGSKKSLARATKAPLQTFHISGPFHFPWKINPGACSVQRWDSIQHRQFTWALRDGFPMNRRLPLSPDTYHKS